MKTTLFVVAIGLSLSTSALATVKTETIKVSGWKCGEVPGEDRKPS